jgi:hypothetical protein
VSVDETMADETAEFFLPENASFAQSADTIEAENSFSDPPEGEHEFIVKVHKAPKQAARKGWYAGKPAEWNVFEVMIKLTMVNDRTASVLDFFDIMPPDPAGQLLYAQATKEPDGKNAGFQAKKLSQFIDRIGFPHSAGQVIPAEAKKLANWNGRRVRAEIVYRQQMDQQTGQPKIDAAGKELKPRPSVKLFSYRTATGQPSALATAAQAPTQPVAQTGPQPVTIEPPTVPSPALSKLNNVL